MESSPPGNGKTTRSELGTVHCPEGYVGVLFHRSKTWVSVLRRFVCNGLLFPTENINLVCIAESDKVHHTWCTVPFDFPYLFQALTSDFGDMLLTQTFFLLYQTFVLYRLLLQGFFCFLFKLYLEVYNKCVKTKAVNFDHLTIAKAKRRDCSVRLIRRRGW